MVVLSCLFLIWYRRVFFRKTIDHLILLNCNLVIHIQVKYIKLLSFESEVYSI